MLQKTNGSHRRMIRGAGFLALATASLITLTATLAGAQTNSPQKDPVSGNATPAGTAVTSGDAQVSPPAKNVEASKATEFSDVGKAIAAPPLKLPEGAESVRQVTAPLAEGKDSVLLNWYKVGGGLFVDILTTHDNQAWVKRNHIALKGEMPIRPDKMALTMRFLEPGKRSGFLIVASDESADLALVLPQGFGGKVSQQVFLVQSSSGARHSYDFGDLDSRGYAIVRESIDSTGEVKPSADVQFFVWNGRTFIHRKAN
jgi:hypothetical protein